MTRLEKQLAEKRNELLKYETLAASGTERLLADLTKINKKLKKYGITISQEQATKNTFIDKSLFDNSLTFRVFIEFDASNLTERKAKNIKKYFQQEKLPVRNLYFEIQRGKLNLYYS